MPTEATIEPLITDFLASWQRLGGTWERHQTIAAARLGLLRTLLDLNARTVLAWPADHLPLPGFADAAHDAGITLIPPALATLAASPTLGLTSADAALAATGSFILLPAPHRTWLPALLPARHILLLPTDHIYPDLETWRRAWETSGRASQVASALIVTGPSFSADIEFHPHRGIFGPRHLHLFLIPSEPDDSTALLHAVS